MNPTEKLCNQIMSRMDTIYLRVDRLFQEKNPENINLVYRTLKFERERLTVLINKCEDKFGDNSATQTQKLETKCDTLWEDICDLEKQLADKRVEYELSREQLHSLTGE
jgi:ABC-type phosphate transport system auxiliary subunit